MRFDANRFKTDANKSSKCSIKAFPLTLTILVANVDIQSRIVRACLHVRVASFRSRSQHSVETDRIVPCAAAIVYVLHAVDGDVLKGCLQTTKRYFSSYI